MPQELIDELRSRLLLSEVVARRVGLKRQGHRFVGLCPFHQEKTPSFTVDDHKGCFYCFGCGAHGDAIEFVRRYEHMSFTDALDRLAGECGIARRDSQRFPSSSTALLHNELYQVLEAATCWFQEQLRSAEGSQALEYLQRRGVSKEAIDRFQLGYAPRSRRSLMEALSGFSQERLNQAGLLRPGVSPGQSFFRARIMFPITDRRGRVVAFGGRALQERGPKYLNSPETILFQKGKSLYGAGLVAGRGRAVAVAAGRNLPREGDLPSTGCRPYGVVVEGYMDVIALSEAGFTALSPLGTALTEAQILALWKLIPDSSPVLCFDGDFGGREAAFRALARTLPLLRADHSMRFAFLPQGHDPDSFVRENGADQFRLLLRESHSLIDLLWEQEMVYRNPDSPETRAGLASALERRTAQIGDLAVRRLYRQDLRTRLAEMERPQLRSQGQLSGKSFGKPGQRVGSNWTARVVPSPLTPARDQRARTMLATIINHPVLFEEFSEPFAHYDPHLPAYQQLKQAILEIFVSIKQLGNSGDSNQPGSDLHVRKLLIHELQRRGFTEFLDKLLHNATYNVPSFSNPESSLDNARAGLQELFVMANRP